MLEGLVDHRTGSCPAHLLGPLLAFEVVHEAHGVADFFFAVLVLDGLLVQGIAPMHDVVFEGERIECGGDGGHFSERVARAEEREIMEWKTKDTYLKTSSECGLRLRTAVHISS